jgi:hypothetical protein
MPTVVVMPANKTSSKKTVGPHLFPELIKVKLLMYAFGDDPNSSPESVAVLEDIVTEYINEMVPFPLFHNFPS